MGKTYTQKQIADILELSWHEVSPDAGNTDGWVACRQLLDQIKWHLRKAEPAPTPKPPPPPKQATEPQEIRKEWPAPKKKGRRA